MGSTRQPRIRLVMEPRHAPLKTAPHRARKKRRVMKKEVASSSTTPSSVSVAAASDGEQPPLLVPVPAGAEAFEYERGKKDIFPKPGELMGGMAGNEECKRCQRRKEVRCATFCIATFALAGHGRTTTRLAQRNSRRLFLSRGCSVPQRSVSYRGCVRRC